MILRTQLVHGVDEYADVIGIDVRRDAVAKIEHVPGTLAVTRQGFRDAVTHDLGALPQDRRVQVAL